jgi:hypothetical protein
MKAMKATVTMTNTACSKRRKIKASMGGPDFRQQGKARWVRHEQSAAAAARRGPQQRT